MSVLAYLETAASELVVSSAEKNSISTSISTLNVRLGNYFTQGEIQENFSFGSYTRETILPRSQDEHSDVDYMVIFKNPNEYKPQTLLGWLKRFAESKYSRSEIYQSHPTMVLELSHIKFELVPAVKNAWGQIQIPSPASGYLDWITTDPNRFNSHLIETNKSNSYKIKPLVRLMKHWNVNKLDRGYSSFLLEQWITNQSYYGCSNLKEYLFTCINALSTNHTTPQYIQNAVLNAKHVVANVKWYEQQGNIILAEQEIKKIIPEV